MFKKIFAILCVTVMALWLSIAVFAHAEDGSASQTFITPEICSVMTTTTTCPNCGSHTFVLYCGEQSVGNGPEVYCSLPSHQPCVIYDRDQFTTMGRCTAPGCHTGTGGQYGTYLYGTHIETCKHTRTGNQTYYTCIY